jgi:hypothetical protein
MIRRTLSGIMALLALAVTALTAVVVAGYWQTPAQRDLLITMPPIVIPAMLAGIGIITTLIPAATHKSSGCMVGLSIGSLLYLMCPALQLLLQYDMISQDGTGFWTVIMLPSVYLGIPLPIFGTLLGLFAGFVLDHRRRKSEPEVT